MFAPILTMAGGSVYMDVHFEQKKREKNKVIAVVVTYNRKEMLLECIAAILNQSYSIEKLILLDNCSTDGTGDILKTNGYLEHPQVRYFKTDSNTGGAGGFYEGMIKAKQYQYDWIWLMDDDTVPASNCLEELLNADQIVENSVSAKGVTCSGRPAFLASTVYGPDGEFMNVPSISTKKAPNGYSYWYQFLDKGIVNIEMATFVSVLINRTAIEKCGLPCKDFFIWGDDSEYTTRLTKYYGDAYLVGKSVALHKRTSPTPIKIESEMNLQRIKLFHYRYRNTVILNKYYQPNYHMHTHILSSILGSLQYLGKTHGWEKIKAIIKGHLEGMVQYKKFKNYIDSQLEGEA